MDEWDEDTYVEAERLPHARLVCSSRHCTETRPGIDGRGKIVYKSTCLEPYVFPDGVRQYFGNPAFETAACMNKRGKCRKCKCPFKMHMVVEHQMVEKKREPKTEVPADSNEVAEDPTTSTKAAEESTEEDELMPKKSLDIPVALLPPIPQPEESELAERSLIYAAAVRRGSKPKLPRFSDVLEVIPPAESSKNSKREEKTIVDAKEDDVESVYSNVPSKPPAAATSRPKKAADQEFEQLACLIDSLMDQGNEKCRRWLLNNPVVVPKEEEADRPFGRVARLLAGVVLRIKWQFGHTHGHRLK